MGIHQLSKVLDENAPSCMKENEIKNYFGRKIAIDASMSIYQFLIAVRSDGSQLTNEQGETTSHLMGLFYRTIRMVDNGIKPVYVFDGKPPEMKSGELAKRSERRAEAQKQLDAATESGDTENVEKFSRRLVKVTPAHNEECKKLLTLMGIPYIEAPCEAEAQCAELVKGGKVFATATEDMDSLTFGSKVVLRHMTFSEARKMPIQEYHLDRILAELELSQDEFIDLCILLGCDYCNSIKGIGPKKAITLIKQHKTIDEVIKHLDKSKYPLPEDWKYKFAGNGQSGSLDGPTSECSFRQPCGLAVEFDNVVFATDVGSGTVQVSSSISNTIHLFKESRELFQKPEVTPASEIELKWSDPDEENLVKFMAEEKQFNEDRIRNGAKKLLKARHSSTQGRLDSFFKVLPSKTPPTKRKNDKAGKGPAAKKAKGSGGKFGRR